MRIETQIQAINQQLLQLTRERLYQQKDSLILAKCALSYGCSILNGTNFQRSEILATVHMNATLFISKFYFHDEYFKVRYENVVGYVFYGALERSPEISAIVNGNFEFNNKNEPPSHPSTNQSSGSGNTSPNTGHSIQTGPRGGKYYINSNGKKTYIKKK